MSEEDNKDDEIINVRLPRGDYKILQDIIKREQALGWFKATISSLWIWATVGGLLTLFALWDKIKAMI